MHYIFLCELYIRKLFARMLNSRAIKFANISENKVLANNIEFTVCPVKPPRLDCDSQTAYIPTDFFFLFNSPIAGLEPVRKSYVASRGDNRLNHSAIPDAPF